MEIQREEMEVASSGSRKANAMEETMLRDQPDVPDILSDEEWENVIRVLPSLVRSRGRRGCQTRKFVEAVLWMATTGAYWNCLPSTYGPSHSVYVRFTRWAHDGLWSTIAGAMKSRRDVAEALTVLVENYLRSRHAQWAKERMLRG